MINNGLFTSKTDQWATPQNFFDKLNAQYNFELDVCADKTNHKVKKYYDEQDNGLIQPWAPYRCWMNPPYGRVIGHWMKKAYDESQLGALVVCLVPARTDTKWWHDYAMRGGGVEFIRGRLKFGDSKNSAPFPSAVVVFKPFSNPIF